MYANIDDSMVELFSLLIKQSQNLVSLSNFPESIPLDSALNSVLLFGPSGIGKSYLVQRLVDQFNVHAIKLDASLLSLKSTGATHVGLRKAFDESIRHQPAVVILDRIETIFPDGDEQTPLAFYYLELLNELRRKQPSILVIGITGHLQRVDTMVANTFMQHVELKRPNFSEKRALFMQCTSGHNLEATLVDTVVKQLHGYVAADIMALYDQGRLQIVEADFTANRSLITPSIAQRAGIHETSDIVQWDDIGGLTATKLYITAILQESVVWTKQYANIYKQMDVFPSRGVLLYGPPGTGKTLLAKAVATESNSGFVSVSIPELIQSHVGESEKALGAIFHSARQSAPCVVFLDELEAIFGSRDSSGDVGRQLITQLMLEIDQLHEDFTDISEETVVLLAATNHPEAIDPAILRAGRLDRLVYVPPPDLADRRAILEIHMAHTPFSATLCEQLRNTTDLLDGYTGADITAVVRIAALHAISRASLSNIQVGL
ncbi:P-loop containing nucleoside triphosphate hydrolase protein [Syncephalis fuscata]|nr:P-loop containing nucleoside triphosphate hydrolase protein [Syncephalis fuscata]